MHARSNGVCQHTCTPDPGPRLVDCVAAEKGLEFSPHLWNFEEDLVEVDKKALYMYSYTDNTQVIATFQSGGNRQTWQPPVAAMQRCSDPANPSNRVIHIQGGPFLAWGGGVGMGMKDYPSRTDGTFPTSPGGPVLSDAAIDASEWEGISFWARRGPDSQAGIRVLVGDKSTDDDIAYRMYRADPSMPRYCERVRECACLNHKPCSVINVTTDADGLIIAPPGFPSVCKPANMPDGTTLAMAFCGEPEVLSGGQLGSTGAVQCNTCEQTRCDELYPAYPDESAPGGPPGTDAQFYGKMCTPHTMRNGISSRWCFDETRERPAETVEQCGDHWTRVVNFSNEWQFYTVPFNTMTQQGWAKRSDSLDLQTVSVVRFTWDGGWIDYWIDDVAFYRHK